MFGTTLVGQFYQFWRSPATLQPTQHSGRNLPVPTATPATLTLQIVPPDDNSPFTRLVAQGVLDRHTVHDFLHSASELYAQGCRHLLVDLHGVTRLELAGRFALQNVARLYRGEELLDDTDGWQVLRQAMSGSHNVECSTVRVLASSTLAAALRASAMDQGLTIYLDRATALQG